MDRQAAQEILLRHRPGTTDELDPDVAAALADWWARQQRFQTGLRRTFAEIQPPPDLKAKLLKREPPRHPFPLWYRPTALAAAAAVVIGLSGVWWIRPPEENSFGNFRNRMVRTALRSYRMDMMTNDLVQLRGYLQQNHGIADYVLTPALEKLSTVGCALLHWHHHPVSLLCFEDESHRLLYLFIIKHSDVSHGPSETASEIAPISKLATASWITGDNLYVLASRGDPESLRKQL